MKLLSLAPCLLAAACASVPGANPVQQAPPIEEAPLEDLVGLEAQSWVAWKAQDAKFFESFLADDHLEVGPNGVLGKAEVVAFIRSHACEVKSYELSAPTVTQISPTAAVLVYRAEQDTRCGGHPVPSPTWATSVYAFRDGRWRNVLYQQMPAAR